MHGLEFGGDEETWQDQRKNALDNGGKTWHVDTWPLEA
jgi:hypothetical protein